MPTKKPGARPSDVFSQRLKEVRTRKGWSQQQLADRLSELGAETDRATLARTESANPLTRRTVTLDDAVTYSVALGVAPLFMVLPTGGGEVAVAPKLRIPAWQARTWFAGGGSLRPEDDRVYFDEVSDELHAQRADTSLRYILDRTQALVEAVSANDADEVSRQIEAINSALTAYKTAFERQDKIRGRK